jgi:hypothetical protein
MLGEYVVRTLNAVSAVQSFHVIERVSDGEPPLRVSS